MIYISIKTKENEMKRMSYYYYYYERSRLSSCL